MSTSSDDNQKYIVCTTTDLPPATEATKGRCFQCGAEVWISKSGRTQCANAKLVCIRCAGKFQGATFAPPNETVINDCAQKLGISPDEVRQRLRRIMENGISPIEQFLAAAAQMAKEHPGAIPQGFISITDPRFRDENGKLQVDIVFKQPGTAFPFFPQPPFNTVEDLINDFDRPEDLVTHQHPGGGVTFVVKRSHLPWIKQREAIVKRVTERHGYTIDSMRDAPWAVVMQMRREIQQQMMELN